VTWNDVAEWQPEFVAWAVARHGPLPDGEVKQEDWERLVAEHREETG
jgi:hypothetical protein